ncbi:MAG: hypothetical protein MI974_19090, partial [Chitinophagales bacterium]|nr:hypothetical protein [Chitinophagales bacterium]
MKNLLSLFMMIMLLASITSAQPCNLNVNAGPDQTLCIDAGTTVLNGTFSGSPINFYWTPSTGLSNPNSQTPIVTLSGAITYTFNVQGLDNTNLFFNGDFESGNSGFSSDYSFVDPSSPLGLAFPGSYSITTSPDIVLDNVPPCDDHTFGNGTGNQMVVNGDGGIGDNIWCQTLSITPNTEYYVSAWMTNYNLLNTPTVQFAVDGVLIGSPFSNGGLCSWQPFEAAFNSGSATVVEICLTNQWSGSGLLMNDFGLDDFSLTAVCTETDDISLTILDPQASIAPPLIIDCNSPLPCISLEGFSNNVNGTVNYQWTASNGGIINSGATTATPEVCSAGTYTLQLSESLNGITCSAPPVSVTVSTNQLPPPAPIINGSPVVCEDDIAAFDILNDLAYISINWIPPAGATIVAGEGTNAVTIDFTGSTSDQLCVIVENNCGILNQTCMDIIIQGDPLSPVISGDNEVCENDTLALYSLDNLEPGNFVAGWTVPDGAVIVSGDETEMLLVDWTNSLGGEVCVEVIGLCGLAQECYDVIVLPQMDTTFVNNTSCNENDVGTLLETYLNQYNCDSVVLVTTSLLPADTTNIAVMSCDLNDVGIEETLLQNQAGCDSLIITTTTYSPADTTSITAMSCDLNNVGIEEILLQNQSGCDSLIITTTTYSPSDTTSITVMSCDPNDVGIEETLLQNQAGCDSLIITTTTYSPADTTSITAMSCDPNDVGVEEILLQNQS